MHCSVCSIQLVCTVLCAAFNWYALFCVQHSTGIHCSVCSDEKFTLVGTMSNVHHALVKITFRPTEGNWDDLAVPIRETLLKKK